MSIGSLLSWMLCGLIVGLVARLLVPGRQNLSFLMTMVLGIVGAAVGGFLYSLVQGSPSEPFSLSGDAWHGWIVAILGAVLVLWAYVSLYPRRRWYQ
ncbi:MAG TPA: GlsB/YeaQ/YmgE family stress response membrane protein [Gemmataceae bacterium]|nr:GlsB/YeaQ/YmgE family stress response membrane protein [Gemmataceae bacterium]